MTRSWLLSRRSCVQSGPWAEIIERASGLIGLPRYLSVHPGGVVITEGPVSDPEDMRGHIVEAVRQVIGPIAKPDKIQFVSGLPKTRSGKIMRRILRKIAENDYGSLGDTSTLADPAVVDDLINNRMNRE